ncbi:hypothetical protein HYV86_02000 [Candidatus Woesearchaeota archaeon]|nr:hypothetical protein [Candidatus Woesearchaeota archaeon]
MKSNLTHFVDSFHFTKQFFETILFEGFGIGSIALAFYLFFVYTQTKAEFLFAGRTTEQLQQYLLNGPTEQVAAFASELQSFIVIFTVCLLILSILSYLLFSYTRKKIWQTLAHDVKWSKWCGLSAAMFFFALVYTFVVAIIRSLVAVIFRSMGENAVSLSGTIVSVIFIILFLLLGFTVAYGLTIKKKVFEGISFGLSLLVKNKTRMSVLFCYAFLMLAVLSLFMYLAHNLVYLSQNTLLFINGFVFFIYLTWLRWYFSCTLKD